VLEHETVLLLAERSLDVPVAVMPFSCRVTAGIASAAYANVSPPSHTRGPRWRTHGERKRPALQALDTGDPVIERLAAICETIPTCLSYTIKAVRLGSYPSSSPLGTS